MAEPLGGLQRRKVVNRNAPANVPNQRSDPEIRNFSIAPLAQIDKLGIALP